MQVGIRKNQMFIVHKPHKYIATLEGLQKFMATFHHKCCAHSCKSLKSNYGMWLKLHPLQCLFVVVAMHLLLGVPIS
jgi:hypothetical protein